MQGGETDDAAHFRQCFETALRVINSEGLVLARVACPVVATACELTDISDLSTAPTEEAPTAGGAASQAPGAASAAPTEEAPTDAPATASAGAASAAPTQEPAALAVDQAQPFAPTGANVNGDGALTFDRAWGFVQGDDKLVLVEAFAKVIDYLQDAIAFTAELDLEGCAPHHLRCVQLMWALLDRHRLEETRQERQMMLWKKGKECPLRPEVGAQAHEKWAHVLASGGNRADAAQKIRQRLLLLAESVGRRYDELHNDPRVAAPFTRPPRNLHEVWRRVGKIVHPDAESHASTLADIIIDRADQVCAVALDEGATAVAVSVSFGDNTELQREVEGDCAVKKQAFAKKTAKVVNAEIMPHPMLQFYIKAAQGAAAAVNGPTGGGSYFIHRLETLVQQKMRALVTKWLQRGLVVVCNFTAIAFCSGYSHLCIRRVTSKSDGTVKLGGAMYWNRPKNVTLSWYLLRHAQNASATLPADTYARIVGDSIRPWTVLFTRAEAQTMATRIQAGAVTLAGLSNQVEKWKQGKGPMPHLVQRMRGLFAGAGTPDNPEMMSYVGCRDGLPDASRLLTPMMTEITEAAEAVKNNILDLCAKFPAYEGEVIAIIEDFRTAAHTDGAAAAALAASATSAQSTTDGAAAAALAASAPSAQFTAAVQATGFQALPSGWHLPAAALAKLFKNIAGCAPRDIRLAVPPQVWTYFDCPSSHETNPLPAASGNKFAVRATMTVSRGAARELRASGASKDLARANFWRLCVQQRALDMQRRHEACTAPSFDTVMNAILEGTLPA